MNACFCFIHGERVSHEDMCAGDISSPVETVPIGDGPVGTVSVRAATLSVDVVSPSSGVIILGFLLGMAASGITAQTCEQLKHLQR